MSNRFDDLARPVRVPNIPSPEVMRFEIEASWQAQAAEREERMLLLTAEIRDLTVDVRDLTRTIRRLTWAAVIIAAGALLAAVVTVIDAVASGA